MRKLSLLCLALLAASCTQQPVTVNRQPETENRQPSPSPSPAARLAAARSWCLYYGSATPDIVDRLSGYDLVVVDPSALGDKAAEIIAALHGRGCLVAGYLSYFEVAKWHRYLPRVKPEWRVQVDGKNWIPWGANEAASLTVPEWRDLLVELTRTEVLDYGCDGAFMDTIADLDGNGLPEEQRVRELEGLDALMSALDTAYPDAIFIGNWTLQRTFPIVAKHADAVCWEDFRPEHFEKPDTRAWMEGIAKNIAATMEKLPDGQSLRILTLCNFDADTADYPALCEAVRTRSESFGYLPYCTKGGYSNLPVFINFKF